MQPSPVGASQYISEYARPSGCMTDSLSHPWFGVRVKSNCETIAAVGLRARGLEEFVPLYTARRRWSDRVRTVQLPLFPGYVFSRFDPAARLPVLTTPGVVHIVGIANRPEPIDDREIAAIQALLRAGLAAEPWPFLRVGQRVRLAEGPLAGVEGLIAGLKQKCRLVVSISLLQRSVAVEIDREWVRPL